jgi:hypothetical protein
VEGVVGVGGANRVGQKKNRQEATVRVSLSLSLSIWLQSHMRCVYVFAYNPYAASDEILLTLWPTEGFVPSAALPSSDSFLGGNKLVGKKDCRKILQIY